MSSISCPLAFQMHLLFFQEVMYVVLQRCDGFATAYFEDFMIFSTTLEEHMHYLKIIFGKLSQHNLRLKLKKCLFL